MDDIDRLRDKLEMVMKTNKRIRYQNACIRSKCEDLHTEIAILKDKLETKTLLLDHIDGQLEIYCGYRMPGLSGLQDLVNRLSRPDLTPRACLWCKTGSTGPVCTHLETCPIYIDYMKLFPKPKKKRRSE